MANNLENRVVRPSLLGLRTKFKFLTDVETRTNHCATTQVIVHEEPFYCERANSRRDTRLSGQATNSSPNILFIERKGIYLRTFVLDLVVDVGNIQVGGNTKSPCDRRLTIVYSLISLTLGLLRVFITKIVPGRQLCGNIVRDTDQIITVE